jgi:Transposase
VAVSFLVIREPVKKHGPGVACGLDIGDAIKAIPFRKLIFAAAPAPGFTHGGRAMPGKKTKRRGKSAGQLSTLNEHAAGLDVGSTFHVVAVRGDQDKEPVRTFRSFSGDLHKMADWLGGIGIKTVAMESTGVYWIPVFEILEARGFEVLLVNARDVKNVPGRKTDVNDAQWLQQLHQHGLLRGSFRPRDEVVRLRAFLRHRERTVEYAASHVQHMQKALMLEPIVRKCEPPIVDSAAGYWQRCPRPLAIPRPPIAPGAIKIRRFGSIASTVTARRAEEPSQSFRSWRRRSRPGRVERRSPPKPSA